LKCKENKKKKNPKSTFSFMKGMLPKYFSSEWSFAQYHVSDSRTIVAFGQDPNSLIIVSAEGSFYRVLFDPEGGGEMAQDKKQKFIKGPDD